MREHFKTALKGTAQAGQAQSASAIWVVFWPCTLGEHGGD